MTDFFAAGLDPCLAAPLASLFNLGAMKEKSLFTTPRVFEHSMEAGMISCEIISTTHHKDSETSTSRIIVEGSLNRNFRQYGQLKSRCIAQQ